MHFNFDYLFSALLVPPSSNLQIRHCAELAIENAVVRITPTEVLMR